MSLVLSRKQGQFINLWVPMPDGREVYIRVGLGEYNAVSGTHVVIDAPPQVLVLRAEVHRKAIRPRRA